MPFQVDRTKTAAANLLGLVNSVSQFAFVGTEWTAGNPSPQTPSDSQELTNSEVTLTAVANSGFVGTKTVRYRRLALGQTHPGSQQTYTITGADTLATIKTAVAVAHNLVESEFVLTGTLPGAGAGANTFTLTANGTSLLYIGSHTVQVIRP